MSTVSQWMASKQANILNSQTGDFIVSYHPTLQNLFVATAGSGHAFKFLPVLGEKIADAIGGELRGDLLEKWKWPDWDGLEETATVVTADGSRSGMRLLELEDLLQINENPL